MVELGKTFLNKIKLIILYFVRIVFVKNNFKVNIFTKLRANIFGGYLADQAVLYDFKNNDRREYLSEFDWYRSRYINAPFDFLMNNKIACTELLKQYVKVPEIYALKHKGVMSAIGKSTVSADYCIDIIKKHKDIFIKPYGKGKGVGVKKYSYLEDSDEFTVDDKPSGSSEIKRELSNKDNWILCQGLSQQGYANEIYSKTINTIRLITLRDVKTEEIKIFFAVQRIGTKETIPVDNGSRGGLVSKIDLDTGALSEARSLHSLDVHKNHPDSGVPIEGVIIPNWNKVKSEMLELANKLPYMNFIAWDIIPDEEGVSVIEANTSSGVNIIQLWGGQRKGELGDFYRHHGVKV